MFLLLSVFRVLDLILVLGYKSNFHNPWRIGIAVTS